VLGSSKVRPKLDGGISVQHKNLGIYMQVYNLKPDEKKHKSNATFQYPVKKGGEQVMQFKETRRNEADRATKSPSSACCPSRPLSPGSIRSKLL